MRVELDGELLDSLIKARGGVRAFVDEWNAVAKTADDHPNNSTVYRWIKGESLPKNSDLFLRLAGRLDVDPFALIAVTDGDILAAAEELVRVVQHTVTPPSWLQFVHGFFGRQLAWPPEDLAKAYFNRRWHISSFTHDATERTNFYARLILSQSTDKERPQVFHFAYRHPTRFHARWLQYGLVRVRGRSIALHHIDGHIARLDRSTLDEPIHVETWFGQGPAIFRVASLHSFTHTIDISAGVAAKAVRFPA
jgi:hypothetical protein